MNNKNIIALHEFYENYRKKINLEKNKILFLVFLHVFQRDPIVDVQ
jgi:hypothetical protein